LVIVGVGCAAEADGEGLGTVGVTGAETAWLVAETFSILIGSRSLTTRLIRPKPKAKVATTIMRAGIKNLGARDLHLSPKSLTIDILK
jgi:hypothetical protein